MRKNVTQRENGKRDNGGRERDRSRKIRMRRRREGGQVREINWLQIKFYIMNNGIIVI